MNKRPLVLVPNNGYAWPSHQEIFPELLKTLREVGVQEYRLWYPSDEKDVDELYRYSEEKASALIIPLGHTHYEALKIVDQLRKRGSRVPLVIMLTCDLGRGLFQVIPLLNGLTDKDFFVTNCSVEAALACEFLGLPKKQVVPIPLPVDQKLYKMFPRGKTDKRRSKKRVNLTYAGRISAQKNLHSLLVALARLPSHYHLTVAGTNDEVGTPHIGAPYERYMLFLGRLIKELGLTERVHLTGKLSQRELFALYKKTDVLVSLSLHSGEDFGYAISQGLAAGLPIVASAWGGHWDFARSPGVFLLPTIHTDRGPQVDISGFEKTLSQALRFKSKSQSSFTKGYFGKVSIQNCWKEILQQQESRRGRPLQAKPTKVFMEHFLDCVSGSREADSGLKMSEAFMDTFLAIQTRTSRKLPHPGKGYLLEGNKAFRDPLLW